MTKKRKILTVFVVLAILISVGIYIYQQSLRTTDKYEDLYPWMKGWSNKKKEYFKLYRFRAVSNWYMGDGGRLSKVEAEKQAIHHWNQGWEDNVKNSPDEWRMWTSLWKEYRELKKLDENGY